MCSIVIHCINDTMSYLHQHPPLLDYIKNFNDTHNKDRTGFLFHNSVEMKTIRQTLCDKGYSGYTIPASLQECEKMLNRK